MVWMLVAFAPLAALAAPPDMKDYAQGAVIETYGSQPMIELALPDSVYQAVTRVDLRDLRVFNAEGAPVPHAFCAAPEASEAAVTEQSLPVFELRDAQRATGGARIEVQTAEGTQVHVEENRGQPPFSDQQKMGTVPSGRTHIIDARSIEDPLRAIQFDWASPDDASTAKVRIEASDDLDRWRRVLASTTLLRVAQGDRTLRRERIEVPLHTYKYLRVQRVDGGPPLILRGVVAERVAPTVELEPVWFMPNALPSEALHILLFDTARAAPVRFARVRLGEDNSSMSVTLQSRADEESPWRDRWSGETYLVVSDTQRRESPPARFEATTDRHWRVLLPREAEASPQPTVELGYRPMRLRFLAQGGGPYTLAYGSRRADLANPASCDGLLADVSAAERRGMIGEAYPGEFKALGGETALKAPPRKTPTRVIVLWGVLIVGAGLLVAMALSLLKRLRPGS